MAPTAANNVLITPTAIPTRNITKQKKGKIQMDKSKIAELKEILLQRKKELLSTARKHWVEGQETKTDAVQDPADMATDSYENELVRDLGDAERRQYEEVEKGLKRIRDGKFGICDSCKGVISAERLKAVPHATLCVKCKQLQEKEAKPSY